ncbi:MAG: IMCp domain-containing protein, partial [bacterium]|nr:IMCp domain-containing protein [bacterium]
MIYKINNKNKKIVIIGLAIFFVMILFSGLSLPAKASSVNLVATSSSNQIVNNSSWSFGGLYKKIINFIFPNNKKNEYTQMYTELDVKKKNLEVELINLDIEKKKVEIELATTVIKKESAEAELATLEIKKKDIEAKQGIVKTKIVVPNVKEKIIETAPFKEFVQEKKVIIETPIKSSKQIKEVIREVLIKNNKIDGNFTVSGNTEIDGKLNITGLAKFNNAIVLGTADLTGDLYNSQGDLIVNDNLVVKSALTTKTLQVIDSAEFSGSINAKDIDSDNISVGKKLTVSGNSTIQGSEQVLGSLRVGGTFSAGHAIFSSIGVDGSFGAKSISSSKDLVVGGKAYLNGEGVDIKGSINAEAGLNVAGNLRVSATSTFSGNVGVGTTTPLANLHIVGSARFDLGSDATGDLLYRNSLGNLGRLGIGANGKFLMASSTATTTGGLLWETISATGITSLNGLVGTIQTFATSSVGTDFSIDSSGDIHTFNLPSATSTVRGLLTSSDWSTFNSKENVLTFNGPLARNFNAISMSTSTSSVDGFLTSVDWNTFNSKENVLTFNGPLARNANIISMSTSTSSVDGFLTSVDWNTFNNKLSITLDDGYLLIGDAFGLASPILLSGDAEISNAGVLTITNNAVGLGVDTVGNYVSGIIAGTGMTVSGTVGEDWSPTVAMDINGLSATSVFNDTDTFAIYNASSTSTKKITRASFLSGITGALVYQGSWNASSNTPALADNTGSKGQYYVVNTAGTQNLGSGNIVLTINDWIIHNGTVWEKLDSANDVQSVFGRIGIISASSGDYIASQITNTPTGNISAITVQSALNELDTEKLTNTLNSGRIFVGNSSNEATAILMGGDITINNTGTTTIGALKVTNTMLAGSIASSKLIGTDIATVGIIASGTWNGVTIGTSYGGTGLNSYIANQLFYASGTGTMGQIATSSLGL